MNYIVGQYLQHYTASFGLKSVNHLENVRSMLQQKNFFGWWLEQQLPTARANFGPKKILLLLLERSSENQIFGIMCDKELILEIHFVVL